MVYPEWRSVMARRLLKILVYLTLSLITLVLLLFATGWLLVRGSLFKTDGQKVLSGVSEQIEITFDQRGIPQIWAQNERDVYFALGYLHASERLFQMDMTRRVASGSLAELLGSTVVDIDKAQRTLGHRRMAREALGRLSTAARLRLFAYVQGVNQGIESMSVRPFEYLLLGQKIRLWTLEDCLTTFSFQTWYANYLVSPDAFLAGIISKIGPEKARQLQEIYPDWSLTTVPRDSLAGQFFPQGRLPNLMTTSSNSWAVDARHSSSGSALFASDPHLDISRLPQFWYVAGLHVRDSGLEVLGITTPGLPFVTMGHNGRAAWAFTVAGIDVHEYYFEQLNQDSTASLFNGQWLPLEIWQDTIRVSGQKEGLPLTIRRTDHGPLLFNDPISGKMISQHWAGFDTDLAAGVESGFSLAAVDSFEQFRLIVTQFGALDVNWMYADKQGNIGYQLGSPIPVRPWAETNLPLPGWDAAFSWQGFYPLEATPHSFNPERGWLATCNNKPDQSHLSYPLQGSFDPGRIMRISELLSAKDQFSAADFQQYQTDRRDAYLLSWKERFAGLLENSGEAEWSRRILAWDGQVSSKSAEAALLIRFLEQVEKDLFSGKVEGRVPTVKWWDLERFLTEPALAEWLDDPATQAAEDSDALLRQSLKKTLAAYQGQAWGEIHNLTMEHPLAVVPGVSELLGLRRGPWPYGGTSSTLNASFFSEEPGQTGHFRSEVGASWRFVIDFADVDGATMVIPAGNSGHPLSPHFMDFNKDWFDGRRWNIPFSREKVEERTVSSLFLIPPGGKK